MGREEKEKMALGGGEDWREVFTFSFLSFLRCDKYFQKIVLFIGGAGSFTAPRLFP